MVCSFHKSILELRQEKKIDFHSSIAGTIHSVRKVIYM